MTKIHRYELEFDKAYKYFYNLLFDANEGNVRCLIDSKGQVSATHNYTAFGEELTPITSPFNPWRYSAKRLDPELGLYYFGKRFYDPAKGRWITTDPVGFVDAINLYQYAYNNPLIYDDPTGESVGGFLLGLGEMVLGGAIMIAGGAVEIGSFGTMTVGVIFAESAGLSLMAHGCSLAMIESRDISMPNNIPIESGSSSSNIASTGYGNAFVYDRFENRSTHCDPDPAAEGSPHTVIEQPGSEGKYTTFNADGTVKQYRGSGKPHGKTPRPNVKETKINPSPTGPRPGNPQVRPAEIGEIPKGK